MFVKINFFYLMTGAAKDDHPATELIESLTKDPFITPVPISCRSAEPLEQKVSSESRCQKHHILLLPFGFQRFVGVSFRWELSSARNIYQNMYKRLKYAVVPCLSMHVNNIHAVM